MKPGDETFMNLICRRFLTLDIWEESMQNWWIYRYLRVSFCSFHYASSSRLYRIILFFFVILLYRAWCFQSMTSSEIGTCLILHTPFHQIQLKTPNSQNFNSTSLIIVSRAGNIFLWNANWAFSNQIKLFLSMKVSSSFNCLMDKKNLIKNQESRKICGRWKRSD